ncbi:PilW family protein [Pseudomonas knackmussii]|uniref:PilW family protein n=1 Tax=Pseudomonas knackmussii TaxID=65741 RepID=UPI0013624076|nr:PilW family protein [Pseudomonas knackmussii]
MIATTIRNRRYQAGLTLVELMIAMTLSLILMLGVIQVFLSARQTYSTNDAISRMQESGRFALTFISNSVRLGGYLEPGSILPKPLPIQGPNCAGPDDTPCSANGNGSASDSIAVAFQVPPDSSDSNKRRDCAGTEITTANAGKVLVNVFRVSNGSLTCSSYFLGETAWLSQNQELVPGIDAMQVLYGISTDGNPESITRYVSANRVSKWADVRAVRVAVLANSQSVVTPLPPQRGYYLLDAPALSPDDGLARQIFSTTIGLKNTY